MIGHVYDPVFLEHDLPGRSEHAEHAGRLAAVQAALERAGMLAELHPVAAREATRAELGRVHSEAHIERVAAICRAGGGYLDPDTYTVPRSWDAATRAVGGLIDLTLAVCAGDLQGGFACLRPPGHHAEADRAMGFCLFANVALAAAAARDAAALQRIAVVDFDVHHGNGTEAIFRDDPDLLYISTHQYPYYPGTGALEDIGSGAGVGATLNIPLPLGAGDATFAAAYDTVILPALRRFDPELLLVSAGYDAHWADPLAGLAVSVAGFARQSRALIDLAAELCAGRIVFALEGGYDLEALAAGVSASVGALLGRGDFDDPLGPANQPEPDCAELLAEIRRLHRLD